jgi:class 3 adenylate cyclase
VATSLSALRDHHHCEACALDFGLDFGESVEIIFRAHPAIRHSELGVFCIGGPGHTPHVVAQVQLTPGERFALDLQLDEGSYLVMGRQMPVAWEFRVERGAELATWEVPLAEGIPPGAARVLTPAGQRIVICNDSDHEVVARIERASGRRDAVTAAEAASSATFRQLFPDEALAPGRMLAVQRLTVLTAALSDPWSDVVDEQQVLGQIGALHHAAEVGCEREGGAVVKIHRDGVLATFTDPAAALRVAESLLREGDRPICVAVEMGSALATSINDRLDYFGRVMHDVDRLLDRSGPGQVVLGETLSADPAATRWLSDGRVATLVEAAAGLVGHAVTIRR